MSYATQSDLENRAGGPDRLELLLADSGGMEIPDRLASAIADAEAESDSCADAFYAGPFSPVPSLVTRWAADLALGSVRVARAQAAQGKELGHVIQLAQQLHLAPDGRLAHQLDLHAPCVRMGIEGHLSSVALEKKIHHYC